MELTKDEILMGFVASCIEEIACMKNMEFEEVINWLDEYGLIDNYIVKHYETLHTESRENIINDILETLELREKKYKSSHC